MTTWLPVIGLELHARLATHSKLFCGCANRVGDAANSLVCPVCAGLPGGMPTLNARACEYAVRLALATGATVARTSRFDRKSYFYPDLPKGYQITQHAAPLARGGALDVFWRGQDVQVPLQRIHLEEDAGKSMHGASADASLVDLNRAGTPLVEVVTEPVLHDAEAAAACARALRQLLRTLRISDGDMEKGSLRCDVNVSVHRSGTPVPEQRVEVKNLNSFRAIRLAIEHETARQIAEWRAGRPVPQETRLWNAETNASETMRGKEQVAQYGYVPETDLGIVSVDPAWLESLRRALPEAPVARRRRWVDAGLTMEQALQLAEDPQAADFFDATLQTGVAPRKLANWMCNEVPAVLQEVGGALDRCALTPQALADLVRLRVAGRLSQPSAKQLLHHLVLHGGEASSEAAVRGWIDEVDDSRERELVRQTLCAHPDVVARYRAGRHGVLSYLVGQVLQAGAPQADPQRVRRLVQEAIETD